jgi:hypothetical protein
VGTDIAAPLGTPVVAPQAGRVIQSNYGTIRGHTITIDHGYYKTLHQHLASRAVAVGNTVKEGQRIGFVGSSGASTGPHLHTEVHDGEIPIDPQPWYAQRGVTLGEDDDMPTVAEIWSAGFGRGENRRTAGQILVSGEAAAKRAEAKTDVILDAIKQLPGVDVMALADALAPRLAAIDADAQAEAIADELAERLQD